MNKWNFSLAEDYQTYEIFDGSPNGDGTTIATTKYYDVAQEICDSHNGLVAEYWDLLDE